MQNSSVSPDHLSVLSRALLCFFPTTFLETAVYALLTKREVKMAGYWPSSFFLRFYGPRRRWLDIYFVMLTNYVSRLQASFVCGTKAGNPEQAR